VVVIGSFGSCFVCGRDLNSRYVYWYSRSIQAQEQGIDGCGLRTRYVAQLSTDHVSYLCFCVESLVEAPVDSYQPTLLDRKTSHDSSHKTW
jgi:hypothetical protein